MDRIYLNRHTMLSPRRCESQFGLQKNASHRREVTKVHFINPPTRTIYTVC